jgi:hypothetical protein
MPPKRQRPNPDRVLRERAKMHNRVRTFAMRLRRRVAAQELEKSLAIQQLDTFMQGQGISATRRAEIMHQHFKTPLPPRHQGHIH